MVHPAYQMILKNGIGAEFLQLDPVLLADKIIQGINEADTGVVAYCDWSTIRVFFDTVHVCNAHIDDKGITFEYRNNGPMHSDLRANRVIYTIILVLSAQ